ncbi:MAG: hypothetical protein ABIO51_03045 [Solirubrobacteraceae bacterium]
MTADDDGRDHAGPAGPGLAPAPTGEPPAGDPIAPPDDPIEGPRRASISELAGFLVDHAGPPIDVWAIAALLESTGVRDRDAVERYGRKDVFALAQAVQLQLPDARAAYDGDGPATTPRRERLGRFVRVYGRGSFFFVPLLLQLVALFAVGISQFASLDFTLREASIVAVAAALSFLVTAGFSQALGYLSPIYVESGKHMLAESVSWKVLGLGAVTVLVAGAGAYAVGSLTGGYPEEDLRVASAYYLLLSAQGLISALLYMLRLFVVMVVATVVSLVVAGVLYKQTSLAVEHVHWIALAVGVGIELLVGGVLLHRRAANTAGDLRLAALPRVRLLAARALPFGVYGFVYFTFLTADRVIAWAAGENPLPLWFHPSYELGLDWALGAIVFALAFLEVTVENFSRMLVPAAERFKVDAVREHNRAVSRFWAKQLAYVGAIAAVGTWLAIIGAVVLHELGALGSADAVYEDPIARYVFGLGVLGYALLTLGIANSVFVMTLNRPWRAIASIGPGVLVSIAVGVVATTFYSYWTAVFGMLAGAFVFAALSSWQTWRTLRHADYYSYAAY